MIKEKFVVVCDHCGKREKKLYRSKREAKNKTKYIRKRNFIYCPECYKKMREQEELRYYENSLNEFSILKSILC